MQSDMLKYILFGVVALIVFTLLRQWNDFSSVYEKNLQLKTNNSIGVANYISDQTLQDKDKHQESRSSKEKFNMLGDGEEPAAPYSEHLSQYITAETDTLKVLIDKRGGDIVKVELLKHKKSLDEPNQPFVLLEKDSRNYYARSGLKKINDNAKRFYSSDENYYKLIDGEELVINLTYIESDGVELTKRYTMKREDYLIDVEHLITNETNSDWSGFFFAHLIRDESPAPGSENAAFGIKSFLGAATTTSEKKYKKVSFKDMRKERFNSVTKDGWVAMIQHYFVSAWVPKGGDEFNYYTKVYESSPPLFSIGLNKRVFVQPGEKKVVGAQFYAGPKDQYRLEKISPHLDLTVDYGWLWMIAQPLYTLLYFFATGEAKLFGESYRLFSGVGNWGLAIIMLTVVIKAVFFQLSAKSYRSMANMRRVQPKLMAIKDQYGDDKQAQSKAMMELYKKEKINPLGGCFPILIQMPVFIALYWALMESVVLRHAPFILWIEDLSVMDPFFLLPFIMGATMFFQQKLNPAPPDPMQAKIMQWMPVVFTFFFIFFPAGLVIYWVSNNVLSIAQQWYITRKIERSS